MNIKNIIIIITELDQLTKMIFKSEDITIKSYKKDIEIILEYGIKNVLDTIKFNYFFDINSIFKNTIDLFIQSYNCNIYTVKRVIYTLLIHHLDLIISSSKKI